MVISWAMVSSLSTRIIIFDPQKKDSKFSIWKSDKSTGVALSRNVESFLASTKIQTICGLLKSYWSGQGTITHYPIDLTNIKLLDGSNYAGLKLHKWPRLRFFFDLPKLHFAANTWCHRSETWHLFGWCHITIYKNFCVNTVETKRHPGEMKTLAKTVCHAGHVHFSAFLELYIFFGWWTKVRHDRKIRFGKRDLSKQSDHVISFPYHIWQNYYAKEFYITIIFLYNFMVWAATIIWQILWIIRETYFISYFITWPFGKSKMTSRKYM